MPSERKPVELLLVEDNQGDVLLTKEAFKSAKLINNLNVVMDGEAALDYLYQRNGYEDAVLPDLILLDLNLPKVSGNEILLDIKQNEKLKRIPVVVMTSSSAEMDIVKTYELHANSYIVKPFDFKKLSEVVNAIEAFWFSVVAFPPKKDD